MPAPAPPGPYATSLSIFDGIDPHGGWILYLRDDAAIDVGSGARWCLDLFPIYPSSEARNLRWQAGAAKNTLQWDAAQNADDYLVLRGAPAELPGLLSGAEDDCIATNVSQQAAGGIDLVPSPGSFYWYLVVGRSHEHAGPSGDARLSGVATPRSSDWGGACVAP